MRCASILSVFLGFLSPLASSQAVRLPGGGCSVSSSGLYACSWLSSPLRPNDAGRRFRLNDYALSPQAPLTIEHPDDTIIVAMDEGILLDETQSPQERINVFKGSGLFVPKGTKTVLRNVGEKSLVLIEIILHQSS